MGPLKGFKIIEFAGIGPGPFCAMLFADMGAVLRDFGFELEEIAALRRSKALA
jgi:hypothetical protein